MPTGAAGLSNGYVVHHGIFNVPLQEFVQTFKTLTYETDQPLDKALNPDGSLVPIPRT
jgi:hypothetical protein